MVFLPFSPSLPSPPRGRSCQWGSVRSSRWQSCQNCPFVPTPPRFALPAIEMMIRCIALIKMEENDNKNDLWDFISHALGKVVSILDCFICTLALLQHCSYDQTLPAKHKTLSYLNFDQWQELQIINLEVVRYYQTEVKCQGALLTWFKIWMKIFMLQMRMGARVLICSRCCPRLSRWLGFKRSFWRPSTSWDTSTFKCFKSGHSVDADISPHNFWPGMKLPDWKHLRLATQSRSNSLCPIKWMRL